MNTGNLTTALHQHLADMPGEEDVFAVTAEHSQNSYQTHCSDREVDRVKQAPLVHAIVGGIPKEGERMGRVSVCASLASAVQS